MNKTVQQQLQAEAASRANDRVTQVRDRLRVNEKLEYVGKGAVKSAFPGVQDWALLAGLYKQLGDTEKMKTCCLNAIQLATEKAATIEKLSPDNASGTYEALRKAHVMMAPYSFHHFLLVLEWDIKPEMKFYTSRFNVIHPWVEDMQALDEGRLEVLTISCPPRVGKSQMGERWMLWAMSRHPGKSILFVSHTAAMADKVLRDILAWTTDPRCHYAEMFPEIAKGVDSSMQNSWIDFPSQEKTGYKTAYFRGLDGGMSGVLEASHVLYLDDVVKNLEEALNPNTLETIWGKVSTDVMQRMTNSHVGILSIATKWSVNDPISKLQELNEGNRKAKFIRIPGLDASGQSNFMYKYNPMDTDHFMKLKKTMDPVSFATIVQQEDMERDGLVFLKDGMHYYDGVLPNDSPDIVCAACDVALGGGDSLAMPIAYVFGTDVYIADVVHNKGSKERTRPLVVQKIITHGIDKVHFEWNAGGDFYMEDISDMLRDQNYHCNITGGRAPSNQSKLMRILGAAPEITGSITDGNGYRLFWLSEKARQSNPEYVSFFNEMLNFSQMPKAVGRQHDDAPDAVSQLVQFVLLSKKNTGGCQVLSRRIFGI